MDEDKKNYRDVYTDAKGTGIVSSLIFGIVTFILMAIVAHFMGN